jgi:hypothetical protein
MDEIDTEKKSRSASRDLAETIEHTPLTLQEEKRVSIETLSLLQQAVGQMKVV